MSTQALAPARTAPGRVSALLRLILLVLGTLAAAGGATAYLLRMSVVPEAHIAAPPAPSPYRALFLRAGQLWAVSPDGRQQQVTHLPAAISTHLLRAVLAPDGRRLALIGDAGAAERAWVLPDPGAAPRPLPNPVPDLAAGSRYIDAAWSGAQRLALLAAQGGRYWLARYALPGSGPARLVARIALPASWGTPRTLSPDGNQVAVTLSQAGNSVFGPQTAVRLLRVDGTHASTAYRYLGAAAPKAVLWSPDRGTVAIAAAAGGLAIQKSSGRPVRWAAHGTLPAAFSEIGAQFAYIAGHPGNWQIRVLALHSEIDRTAVSGLPTAPSSLYWTPDARALLYVTGTSLWQVDPGIGAPRLVARSVTGTPAPVVAATGAFAR